MKCTWSASIGDGVKQVIIALSWRCSPNRTVPAAAAVSEKLFDLVGESGCAVDHHAQRVVELAEVGVLHQLPGVFLRLEATDLDVEPHDEDPQQGPH